MVWLFLLFLLSSIIETVCIVLVLRIESSDFILLVINDLYVIDNTMCNPNWSLQFVYYPPSGFANSFRALRGIITLALVLIASVTSRDSSAFLSVATWKSYCSELDESLSCICNSSSYSASTNSGTRVNNIYQFYGDVINGRIINGTCIIKYHYDASIHFNSQKRLTALRESGIVGETETWNDARIRLSIRFFRPNKRILDLVSHIDRSQILFNWEFD